MTLAALKFFHKGMAHGKEFNSMIDGRGFPTFLFFPLDFFVVFVEKGWEVDALFLCLFQVSLVYLSKSVQYSIQY